METKIATTTIQSLKKALIKYSEYISKSNTSGNRNMYDSLSDGVWRDEIMPFVQNENIEGWEKDIQAKFCNNPYQRFVMSEKQAYCLAKAFQRVNQETIID